MVPKGQQLTFLYTDNLARAVGFYRDVLDLELVVDQGRAVLFRVNDGAYLGVSDRPDRPRGTAGVMVSFVCDVDRAYAKLTARGVAFEGPPGAQMDGTVYAAFFRDPDGYRLELQEFRDPRWDALFAVGDGARLYSGAPFEAQAGYARAVVAGELVHVSGTTGFDPDTLEGRLAAGNDAALELDDVVEERTVNVQEDLDEDEFFSTATGNTTVVNRYDLEKAVPMEKKTHFREVERYWVNKP
ncbi:MAG: VOC family protein, partial [Alphaproteobacteria bacterium]